MRYSVDLRKRVLQFIKEGGSKSQAARTFKVCRASIYIWLKMDDISAYQRPGPRKPHKLERKALSAHVEDYPDKTHSERARHFGVSRHCIWYNLRTLKISRKKKRLITRSATQPEEDNFFVFVNVIADRVNTSSTLMKAVLNYKQPGGLGMLLAVSEFTGKSPGRNVPALLCWRLGCRMENSLRGCFGKAPVILLSSTSGVKSC